MADYGRVAQILAEVGLLEPTEIGRVASLFVEVGATESTEKGRVAEVFAEVGVVPPQDGRVAALLAEVGATESTEKGTVASLFSEVGATESTEMGRVAQIFAEVGAHEDVPDTGHLQAICVEVVAKPTPKIRVNGVWAEVFLTPGPAPPVTGISYVIQGTQFPAYLDLQGGPIQGRFRR